MIEYHCIICGKLISLESVKRHLEQNKPNKYCSVSCGAKDLEIKEKQRLTNLSRYGCEFTLQNKQVCDHKKQTMIDRYGEDYGVLIRKKGTKTNLEKYGNDVPANLESSRSKENYRAHYYESFKQLLKLRCVELLDDYETYLITNIFHYKCLNCGKQWESSFHDGYHFKPCSCCKNMLEAQVVNYIKQLLPNDLIQVNVRGLLEDKRYELDIYIPSLKAGIEVDGTRYHSEQLRGKLTQQNKSLMCLKAGISLMHVYEYSWNNNQETTKIKIKQFIQDVRDRKESNQILDLDCFVCPCNPIIESINEPTILVEESNNIVYNAGTATLRR